MEGKKFSWWWPPVLKFDLAINSNVNAVVWWEPEKELWRQAKLWCIFDGYRGLMPLVAHLQEQFSKSTMKPSACLDLVCKLRGVFLIYFGIFKVLKNEDIKLFLWAHKLYDVLAAHMGSSTRCSLVQVKYTGKSNPYFELVRTLLFSFNKTLSHTLYLYVILLFLCLSADCDSIIQHLRKKKKQAEVKDAIICLGWYWVFSYWK